MSEDIDLRRRRAKARMRARGYLEEASSEETPEVQAEEPDMTQALLGIQESAVDDPRTERYAKYIEEKTKPTQSQAFMRGVGQGVSFGFADELEAGAKSLFSDDEYKEILKAVRESGEKAASEYPITSLAGSLVGGLSLPGGAVVKGGSKALQLLSPSTVDKLTKIAKSAPQLTGFTSKIAQTATGTAKVIPDVALAVYGIQEGDFDPDKLLTDTTTGAGVAATLTFLLTRGKADASKAQELEKRGKQLLAYLDDDTIKALEAKGYNVDNMFEKAASRDMVELGLEDPKKYAGVLVSRLDESTDRLQNFVKSLDPEKQTNVGVSISQAANRAIDELKLPTDSEAYRKTTSDIIKKLNKKQRQISLLTKDITQTAPLKARQEVSNINDKISKIDKLLEKRVINKDRVGLERFKSTKDINVLQEKVAELNRKSKTEGLSSLERAKRDQMNAAIKLKREQLQDISDRRNLLAKQREVLQVKRDRILDSVEADSSKKIALDDLVETSKKLVDDLDNAQFSSMAPVKFLREVRDRYRSEFKDSNDIADLVKVKSRLYDDVKNWAASRPDLGDDISKNNLARTMASNVMEEIDNIIINKIGTEDTKRLYDAIKGDFRENITLLKGFEKLYPGLAPTLKQAERDYIRSLETVSPLKMIGESIKSMFPVITNRETSIAQRVGSKISEEAKAPGAFARDLSVSKSLSKKAESAARGQKTPKDLLERISREAARKSASGQRSILEILQDKE